MQRRDHRTLLVFVLVALFSAVLAINSPLASAEVGDVNSISGTVLRPNLSPARGILVTGTELLGSGDTFTVVTDTDGTYSAVGLTAGNWSVKFEDLDNKTLATEWYNGAATAAAATPVVVTDGLETPGIDTTLAVGAAINGTVVDSTGGAVPATVELFAADGTTLLDTQTAGADGSYRLRGLQAGTYTVRATDPNFGVTAWAGGGAAPGIPIVLTEGDINSGHTITLSGGRINGSVTAGGSPAGGIPVSFNGTATVFSGSDGSFASPFLMPGSYSVTFGGLGTVSAGSVTTTAIALGPTELTGEMPISGTATSGGVGLAGVNVSITNGAYTTMTETAANGTYTAYVPAGSFTVSFTSPYYATVNVAGVAPGGTANAAMTANTVTGAIPDGTTIQTNGTSVNGLPRISGFSGPRLDHADCPGGFAEVVLDDGTTTWSQQMDEIGVATGDYFVKIPQVSTIGLSGKTLITITVDCNPTATSFYVYIDPAGRVFDTDGLPVFDAIVTLYRDNPLTGAVDFAVVPTGSAVMDPTINSVNPDTTDAAGFFRWDLAPGTYKVTAEKAGCNAPGDTSTLIVSTAAFTAPTLNLRLTLECPPPPPPVTPDDNPEVSPGGECPSVGALDPFLDVPSTSFADKDVTCIFQLHVTTGTSPTMYSPKDFVTREQMASFLARLYTALTGGAAPVVTTPFADLSSASAFAVQDIGRIYGLGVTTGTSATMYSPKDLVTREQMASFLARLFRAVTASDAQAVATPFKDVPDTSFAKKDVGRIYGLGVTTGTSATMYSPKDFVTREQMASFLARLFRAAGGSLT